MDHQPPNQKNKRKLINGLARIFIRSVIEAAGSENKDNNSVSETREEKAEKINNFIDKYSNSSAKACAQSNQTERESSSFSPLLNNDNSCEKWDVDDDQEVAGSEIPKNLIYKTSNQENLLQTPGHHSTDDNDKCSSKVSPCGSDRWSPELLKAHALPPGTSWADLVEDDMEDLLVQMSPALLKYSNPAKKTPDKNVLSLGMGSPTTQPQNCTSPNTKKQMDSFGDTRRHINFQPTQVSNICPSTEDWADELLDVLSHMESSSSLKNEYVKEKNVTVTVNDGVKSSCVRVHTRLDIDSNNSYNDPHRSGANKITNKLNNSTTSCSIQNSTSNRNYSGSKENENFRREHRNNMIYKNTNRYPDQMQKLKTPHSPQNKHFFINKENAVSQTIPISKSTQNQTTHKLSSSPEDWTSELMDVPDTCLPQCNNDRKQNINEKLPTRTVPDLTSEKFLQVQSAPDSSITNEYATNTENDGEKNSKTAGNVTHTSKTDQEPVDKTLNKSKHKTMTGVNAGCVEDLVNESWTSELMIITTPPKRLAMRKENIGSDLLTTIDKVDKPEISGTEMINNIDNDDNKFSAANQKVENNTIQTMVNESEHKKMDYHPAETSQTTTCIDLALPVTDGISSTPTELMEGSTEDLNTFDKDSLDSLSRSSSLRELADLCDLPYSDKNDDSDKEFPVIAKQYDNSVARKNSFTSIDDAILFLDRLRNSELLTDNKTSVDSLVVNQGTGSVIDINLSINVQNTNCCDCPCKLSPFFQSWKEMQPPQTWGWYQHGYYPPMPPPPFNYYPPDSATYPDNIQVSPEGVRPPIEDKLQNDGNFVHGTDADNQTNCRENTESCCDRNPHMFFESENLMDIEGGVNVENFTDSNSNSRRSSCSSLLHRSLVQYSSSSSLSNSDNDDKENIILKNGTSDNMNSQQNAKRNYIQNSGEKRLKRSNSPSPVQTSYQKVLFKMKKRNEEIRKGCFEDDKNACFNFLYDDEDFKRNEKYSCNGNLKDTSSDKCVTNVESQNGVNFDLSSTNTHDATWKNNEQTETVEKTKKTSPDKNIHLSHQDNLKNKSSWSEIVKSNKNVYSNNLMTCTNSESLNGNVKSDYCKPPTQFGKPTVLRKKSLKTVIDKRKVELSQCDDADESQQTHVPPFKRQSEMENVTSHPPTTPQKYTTAPPGFTSSASTSSPLLNYMCENNWSEYYDNFPTVGSGTPETNSGKSPADDGKPLASAWSTYGQWRKPDYPFWYTPPPPPRAMPNQMYGSPYYSPGNCTTQNFHNSESSAKQSLFDISPTGSSRIDNLKKRLEVGKFIPPRIQRKHLQNQGYTLAEINTVLGPQPESHLDYDWKKKFKERCERYDVDYIDSHCHIDLLFYRQGFSGSFTKYKVVHEETFPSNYAGCVAIFCNPFSFKPNGLWRDVAEERDVWLAMGCHPKCATDFTERAAEQLEMCLKHEKMVALGEIGLDYSGKFYEHKEVQKTVFIRHLRIAMKMKKPLVIHCRDAEEDILEIMEQYVPRDYKIHCHCFTGNYNSAEKWMNIFTNVYFGLTPLVTFRTATPTHEVARKIPLEKLLLETDAPYFVPQRIPRGEMKFSHPGMAIIVAEEVALLKGISVLDVLMACRNNTCAMYGI